MATSQRCATHCWHEVYAAPGEWATICCACGAAYVHGDFERPTSPPVTPHGSYIDIGNIYHGDLRWTWLSDEEVRALTGMVRRTKGAFLSGIHTHTLVFGIYDGE
jgi:hypothetical protein